MRKGLQFWQSRRATLAFWRPFSQALARGDLDEAQRLADSTPASPLAASLRSVIPSLQIGPDEAQFDDWELGAVERVTELSALDQLAILRRGLGILATTGATAPFVGLLGTVVGVVNAFSGMAASGSGGLSSVTQGIAEALITTAVGLIIAIPAVWLYNYFVDRMELMSMEISAGGKELLDFMLRERRRARSRAH
jgi:biopolymer transport protein ExbB/biopolymer transport protein TolQ